MRRVWVAGILILIALLFVGCTAEVIVPISYGSAQICSGRSGIYGEVYVDGDYVGYLEPYECVLASGLVLGRWHTVRVYHPWGTVYREDFYLDHSGQVVTIY